MIPTTNNNTANNLSASSWPDATRKALFRPSWPMSWQVEATRRENLTTQNIALIPEITTSEVSSDVFSRRICR